ncbi:uncharacterized protein TM35_001141050 [Trypanosoma theileri]|uniref:Uncharacterized protein n=1 Tax=Trypanosoma theileri TaxID=67003 RepID=A0A1X0NE44_9TRYP|nr:uncharacterized protein TM35_001141050 [Trypanosoma theileri]ORC81510.1 hypothetical protein TM35_001141050 [Trypanosoma theileri]
MLACRVLCLWAILFCCVSVSGATETVEHKIEINKELKSITEMADEAVAFVKEANATRNETLHLKDQCNAAAEYATYLTREATTFVESLDQFVKTAENDPSDGEAEKKKGDELLEKITNAAADAENTARLTTAATVPTIEYGLAARQLLIYFIYSYEKKKSSMEQPDGGDKLKQLETIHKKVETAFPYTNGTALSELSLGALIAAEDADEAALKAEAAVKSAKIAANLLMEALKKLEEVITAAKERIKEIPPRQNQGSANTTGDKGVPGDFTTNKQPSSASTTVTSDTQETNPTTPPSIENTTTDASTTTTTTTTLPSASTTEITNSIASTVQKKTNVDSSSVSPVWMRTAAPLLIVVVLFSATVY